MWLFVVLILLIILWIHINNSPDERLRELGDRIPGPKAYPFVGSLHVFFNRTKSTAEIAMDLRKKYGSLFRLWAGKRLLVVMNDAEDMEVFLSTTKFITKPYSYRLLDPWLGDTNLLTGNGENWKLHRKLLTPSFHFKILENSVPMIMRNARILCDKIATELNGDGFDIESYIEKSALDIICETAMGAQLNTQLTGSSVYFDSIKKASQALLKRFLTPWLMSEIIFKFSSTGRIYHQNVQLIKNEGRKVIAKRKTLLKENSIRPEEDRYQDSEESSRKKLKPFLDFLLTNGNFNDEEIENEVQTFMFAGHDTTKSAISFCLYNLAQHQEAQEKAAQEIREILLNIDEPTYQDYQSLKYLENVIKESMRLHSPVPLISRLAEEDVKVPSGYVIPKGACVDISIFAAHRNPKYFPEPEKFIPERFEARDEKRNPYAFVPFSAGPRNCIGQKFAWLEMKIVISQLLMKYQFLPDEQAEPVKLESALILRSSNKIPVKIKKRE